MLRSVIGSVSEETRQEILRLIERICDILQKQLDENATVLMVALVERIPALYEVTKMAEKMCIKLLKNAPSSNAQSICDYVSTRLRIACQSLLQSYFNCKRLRFQVSSMSAATNLHL